MVATPASGRSSTRCLRSSAGKQRRDLLAHQPLEELG
jgi:hypothetical protein